MVPVGETAWVPLILLAPLQPPDAVQLVALVELQVRLALPPRATVAGLAKNETVGAGVGGGVVMFDTVTDLPAEVTLFPAASLATAVRVCAPLVALVVFQVIEYGAEVSSAPRFVPSSLN